MLKTLKNQLKNVDFVLYKRKMYILMEISRNNHYVPIWYQKRFMLKEQTSYFCLDKKSGYCFIPGRSCVKKEEILHKGPSCFFCQKDLYTTRSLFTGEENDEIEKYLFGKIDIEGRLAFEALMSEDWMSEANERYSHLFEYIDAQLLRTPRGIFWIKKSSNAKSQNELMLYMQAIRLAHCVTWIESAKEIVSAEKSETKFIVSDNPVALYNPKYHPNRDWHQYERADGIPIFHKGTRTLFPIDMNHCLILYNPEYTQNPTLKIALENRTNSRLYDNIIHRTDDINKTKLLSEKEVLQINLLLKNNAERYISASREEWLYPERIVNPSWISFNKLLLPKYPRFPGEMYTFGKDGKLSYTQDGFGRKPSNLAEWEEKAKEAQRIHENIEKALENERKRKKSEM
ncbi:MAG TPA: DUF4238 domain-containing protein [Candidatus Bathyarchaeia archaeon]|nr:DUF4238 domain-containing protein [Candidatus Bathyarchaeia archaeon]